MQRNGVIGIRWSAIVAIGTVLAACGGGSGGRAPVIESLTASPGWLTVGGSAMISWSVINATSVSLAPLGEQTGTSASVAPSADTTYVLTATNTYGSTTAQITIPVYPPPNVWFAPYPLVAPGDGSVDYMQLFQQGAPWTNAASHVQVFKVYAGMWGGDPSYSTADMTNMINFLASQHIGLATEWGPLIPGFNCGGGGLEGFAGQYGLGDAQIIARLGGNLHYIAFDEPEYYGGLYTGANACNWTETLLAQKAAATVAQIRTVFPDVIVGDIEPVPALYVTPDWLDHYLAWIDAWQATTGTPFAFFDFDVQQGTDWRPWDTALRIALAARGVPHGVIYDGTSTQNTDDEWISAAEGFFTLRELYGSPPPDQVIFQSWNPNPSHVLPETDPGAFTYLIDTYFRTRTVMTATLGVGAISGDLALSSGAPVAMAPINATATATDGSGQTVNFGPVQTAADGSFTLSPVVLPAGNFELWTQYAGSDTLWPAASGTAVGSAPPLALTTASLPDGTAGTAYNQDLSASGGTPPYVWVGWGAPSGIVVHQDGTVSGTPAVSGTYSVAVWVVDDSEPTQVVTAKLSLIIH